MKCYPDTTGRNKIYKEKDNTRVGGGQERVIGKEKGIEGGKRRMDEKGKSS